MKFKTLSLFVAACAIATASYAQQEKPKVEVKTRDNGTKKITKVNADGSTTVTKTGKTNVGATLDNSVDAAGNVAKKGAKVVKVGAKKVTGTTKKATAKAEKATE